MSGIRLGFIHPSGHTQCVANLVKLTYSFKTHIDTLFLITHTSTFNISLQALVLIHQITASLTSSTRPSASTSTSDAAPASASFATSLADRFYRTLYASLADARLATSNKQAMYLNLLFKALRGDAHVERVRAVVRRFVQVLAVGIGGAGGAEFVAGGLYLLGEVSAFAAEISGIWRADLFFLYFWG